MTFDVFENPRTGEYAVLRQPASGPDGPDGMTVADLYVRPGASVPYEHLHPAMTETFTVLRGRLGLRLDGREDEAGPGERVIVPPGMSHAWWNSGAETAWVLVEVDPGARFELLIKNMFALATDGRTDDRGRPGLPPTTDRPTASRVGATRNHHRATTSRHLTARAVSGDERRSSGADVEFLHCVYLSLHDRQLMVI